MTQCNLALQHQTIVLFNNDKILDMNARSTIEFLQIMGGTNFLSFAIIPSLQVSWREKREGASSMLLAPVVLR